MTVSEYNISIKDRKVMEECKCCIMWWLINFAFHHILRVYERYKIEEMKWE